MAMPKVLKDIKDVRDESITATSATLTSGAIVLTVPVDVCTGSVVKFTAPCACSSVTAGITIGSNTYSVVDANGVAVSNAWISGAIVSVLLDCTNKKAYLQNGADIRVVNSIIPMGWLHGDVNHDGYVDTIDVDYVRNGPTSVSTIPNYLNRSTEELFPDGNVPIDFLAADVNGDTFINAQDTNKIRSTKILQERKYGELGDITGNWTPNPNYATEEAQYYYDITDAAIKANSQITLVAPGSALELCKMSFVLADGYVRVYTDILPVSDVACVLLVSEGTAGVSLVGRGEDPVSRIKEKTGACISTVGVWRRDHLYDTVSFDTTLTDGTDTFNMHVKWFTNEYYTTTGQLGYGIGIVDGETDEYLFKLTYDLDVYSFYIPDFEATYTGTAPTNIRLAPAFSNQDNETVFAPLNNVVKAFGSAGKVLGFVEDCVLGPIDAGGGGSSTLVTLTTSGWTLGDSRYYQTVAVEGVTTDESQVIHVDVDLTGTDLDADAAVLEAWAGPSAHNIDQGDGTLTFYTYDVPDVNIPINVGV